MSADGVRALAKDEIHVWSFALGVQAALLSVTLSPDERTRAAAFHFARDRGHFIAAHGRLRQLLSNYVDVAPSLLRFDTNAYGKPALAASLAGDLRFNLSHSHGHALLAVARGCEVGVDLEQMRDEVDCAGIVASHFSPAERQAWAALPEVKRRAGFFHGWVRKEAYVKALGEGLSHEANAYTVDLDPETPGKLVADTLISEAAEKWIVRALPAPAGFAAALAYAGPERCVRLREWGTVD